MTTYRAARGVSPPSRRYADSRNSTGPVFSTAFDTRYTQHPRDDFDTLPPSRAGAERHYDTQPISRKTYGASGHAAPQSKTEYSVRPRKDSSLGDDGRTPLRILPPPTSPTRTRPVVDNSPYDQARSPLIKRYYPPEESDRYIVPAVSSPHHRRQMSATLPDSSHLAPLGRDRRERGGYRVAGARVYATGGVPARYDDEDDYSYTTPREQFDRDYPPREARPRPNSYTRKAHPVSTSEFDGWRAASLQKGEAGPPPAIRQFDRIGNGESRHHMSRSGNLSDTEGDLDRPRRRHTVKAPVALHQDRDERSLHSRDDDRSARRASPYRPRAYGEEPAYGSDRENYRSGHRYERHRQRQQGREGSHERTSKNHGIAATGFGGLAVAGLTNALAGKSRDKDDDPTSDQTRDVKDRHVREKVENFRDISEEKERSVEKLKDKAADFRHESVPRDRQREHRKKEIAGNDSIDDTPPEGRRHRRKHRRRRHSSRPQEQDSDSTSDNRKGVEMPEAIDHDRRERDSGQEDPEISRRHLRHSHAHQLVLSEDERHGETAVENDKDEDEERRAARLQLVEPSKEKEAEPRPKGILKPARQVPFPEDPNPTREGVAPLKDAGKKGIPPGARWTKINRMLVNPAALEAAHERFEERDDYVIVLRVLLPEEVQDLAHKTKEIREARELEWPERQERRRREKGRRLSDGSSDEERRPPLAIEAAAPSTDPRYQQAYPSTVNSRSGPDTDLVGGFGTQT